MKKLLLALISVFVLVNFAFAQSAQQKVDSLKKEQAKAEQAKKAADDRLRNDMIDKNYQAVKAARENLEKLNKELADALNAQKAEAEAKAQAEKERALALYKKKFPEFEFAGVDDAIKEYMVEELRKDPNWDIIEISIDTGIDEVVKKEWVPYNSEGVAVIREGRTIQLRYYYPLCYILIRSTSNPQGEEIVFTKEDTSREDARNALNSFRAPIDRAIAWRKNPEEFYLVKKEEERKLEIEREKELKEKELIEKLTKENIALNKMQKAVLAYYKEYTGKNYDIKSAIVLKKCKSVTFYYINIPKQDNINFVFNQNNNSAFIQRQNDANYVYAVCGRDVESNLIIRPNHFYFDKIYAEKHPRKTMKTFKIEDYM